MNEPTTSVPLSPAARRILFLSDLGFQYGAGVAQARQVQSMLAAGWEVGVVAWEPGGIEFEQVTTRPVDAELWLGQKRVRHLNPGEEMSDSAVIAALLCEVAQFAPEVVIVGNLHGAGWSLRLLSALREMDCRVIAYLHDGYLFSGRCAYPGTCTLYLTGCDETCPTADEYPVLAPPLIAGQWRLRREIFNGPTGVEVIANSQWTRDRFRAALPLCHSCEAIYLAADEDAFRPGDKQAARIRLGLPVDKPVVLCAAVNFQEKRKGGQHLQAIVAALQDTVTFAAFGHNAGDIPGLVGMGYHTDAPTLASIYQSADLFLGTAIEEAFGQTIMEAQLCGLPVVAFQAGGVVEIIRNEMTGRLVPIGDVAATVAAIRSILGDADFLARAGAYARQNAASRFSLLAQAQAWSDYLSGRIARGTGLNPPTLLHDPEAIAGPSAHRPSWPGEGSRDTFLTAEHGRIFELTAGMPGRLTPVASFKLYEMGYHAGDVILEIGTNGGRAATMALRGALSHPARTRSPQFYGLAHSPEALARSRQILGDNGLVNYCHLFAGRLEHFVARWAIEPTMVFLDGDHRYEDAVADLMLLSRDLKPGVPVLVHDYLAAPEAGESTGTRRAAEEWVTTGKARLIGCFGCAGLFLTCPAPCK